MLVFHDLLGLEDRLSPKFVRRYAELGTVASEALGRFVEDVRSGAFPNEDESYDDPSLGDGSVRKIYG